MTTPKVAVDHLWEKVGVFGYYQWLVLISLPFTVLAGSGNFLLSSFLILEPEWGCCSPDDSEPDKIHSIHSKSHWTDSSAGSCDKSTVNFGKNCSVLDNCPDGNIVYRADFHSIAEEWGLLCGEKSYLVHSAISLQNFPALVGLLIWGPLSDRYGRKPVNIVAFIAMITTCLMTAFASNMFIFTVLRMIFGFTFSGAANLFQSWAMEMTDQSWGFLYNALTHWHYAYVLVALIGYLTQSWKGYLLVLNIICIPAIFFYSFHYLESPRWLVRKGRLEQAASIMQQIAHKNGNKTVKISAKDLRSSESDLSSAVPSAEHEKLNGSHFFALFATKERAKYSLCLALTFLTASFASGTIILDIGNLWGNIYMNFLLLGSFRCLTPAVSTYLDWKMPNFGRRKFFVLAECIVLFCFVMVIVSRNLLVPWFPGVGEPLVTVSSLAGAIMNMLVWIVIVQITFELYPTLLKNTAFSYVMFMDAMGGVLVPQVVFLRKFYTSAPAYVVSMMILLTILSGYLIYPETKRDGHSRPSIPSSLLPTVKRNPGFDQRPLLNDEDEETEMN